MDAKGKPLSEGERFRRQMKLLARRQKLKEEYDRKAQTPFESRTELAQLWKEMAAVMAEFRELVARGKRQSE